MDGRRPTISSRNGVVAAAHPLAASAGAQMLAAGGNAFDAVVAVASTLNVVEPFMSSLAGMGLVTAWIAAEKRVDTLNFVPPIPRAFPVGRYTKRDDMQRGAHSVGTPGNLAGWAEINRRYGSLPFADCLQPAIRAARGGYPVTEFNVFETNLTAPDLERFPDLYGPWSRVYTDGSGRQSLGWVLKQPELADTYEAIAKYGPQYLYDGPLGQEIVAHLKAGGGCVTLADLETFAAGLAEQWRAPTSIAYRGGTLHVPPPPCEGFQMAIALRILDGFDLAKLENNGTEHLDTVLRAIRLAAGDRIANNRATPATLAQLLSDAHIERHRARVRDGRPIDGPTEQWTGAPQKEHHTTSMSIGDADGNLVCLTNSIGSPYGSGVIVPGTGLVMNNFLYWADVNPASPNLAKPGDALPMCMAPTITTREGTGVLALGTPGSYGILQTQVQAYLQHVDFKHALQDAIEQPRVRLWDGTLIEPETRVAPAVLAELKRRGHTIKPSTEWTMTVGGMHGVARDPLTGALTGGCDPRRDGYVVPV